MIRKVSAEDIAIRGNRTGLEYMCPTRHFVYIFFNPVFQVSTAKNEINLFNNHILIVAPVTFAPAGAMTPSAEFLFEKPIHNAIRHFLVISSISPLSFVFLLVFSVFLFHLEGWAQDWRKSDGWFSPNLISSPWRRYEDYNISFCKQWKFRCHCSYEQWHLNLHCLQRGPSCP